MNLAYEPNSADRLREVAARLSAFAAEVGPVDRVQDVAGELIRQFLLVVLHQRELPAFARLGQLFLRPIRRRGRRLVVIVVMQLDRARVDGGLERIVAVGQGRDRVFPGVVGQLVLEARGSLCPRGIRGGNASPPAITEPSRKSLRVSMATTLLAE